MFTKEKAAQYFIVGWVKEWSLLTYAQIIAETRYPNHDEVIKAFPWMPANTDWRRKRIRPYVSDNMRNLSEKLWAVKDSGAFMALAPLVVKYNIGDKKTTRYYRPINETLAAERRFQKAALAERMSTETMRRGGGHHWNVCK